MTTLVDTDSLPFRSAKPLLVAFMVSCAFAVSPVPATAQTYIAQHFPPSLSNYLGETDTLLTNLTLVYSTGIPSWNDVNARHADSAEIGTWMNSLLTDPAVNNQTLSYTSAWLKSGSVYVLLAAARSDSNAGEYVSTQLYPPSGQGNQYFSLWRTALWNWVMTVGDHSDIKMTAEISAYTQLSADRSVLDAFLFNPANFGDCEHQTYQGPCKECCDDAKDVNLSRCGRIGTGTTIGGGVAGACVGGPFGVLIGGVVGAAVGWAIDNACQEIVFAAHKICKTQCDSKSDGPPPPH